MFFLEESGVASALQRGASFPTFPHLRNPLCTPEHAGSMYLCKLDLNIIQEKLLV